MSSHSQSREVALTVEVSEDDLSRLNALVDDGGSGTFAELLSSALHRGIVESHRAARPRSDSSPPPRAVLGAVGLATIVVIVGSYAGDWTWTGLRKNGQVWDWMELLLLPVAIGTWCSHGS